MLSLVEAVLILTFVPMLGHWVWPKVLAFLAENEIERWKFAFVSSWVANTATFSIANLIFMVIYRMKHPFFE